MQSLKEIVTIEVNDSARPQIGTRVEWHIKLHQSPVGALRYRGGSHLRYVFRGRRGLFLRPPHVRDFVKEGYFFVPRYEVWGSKSLYNPRNIRGSDAEWLPKWLGFPVCCRHLLPPLADAKQAEDYQIESQNTCTRSSNVSVLLKEGVFIKWKKTAFN